MSATKPLVLNNREEERTWKQYAVWAGVVVCTIVAAWLQLHAIAAKSLWFDEGTSIAIARLDWFNFLRLMWRREMNMVLYYLLLRGWLHLGDSVAWIRGLSVIFATAAIPAIFVLGRKMLGTSAGIISAAPAEWLQVLVSGSSQPATRGSATPSAATAAGASTGSISLLGASRAEASRADAGAPAMATVSPAQTASARAVVAYSVRTRAIRSASASAVEAVSLAGALP